MRILFTCLFCLLLSPLSLALPVEPQKECVILLHGLARTSSSMAKIEDALQKENYRVVNIDYASREHAIDKLASIAISEGLKTCRIYRPNHINFVTHSLGGILVRQYLSTNKIVELKRVVMLGPPNNGSEVVDNLKGMPGFKALNGPAGQQLGTSATDTPKLLGPVDFELGVIAGTQSINLILSNYLPNPDDGKVSAQSTKVEGMKDFIALPTTHTFMMKNEKVINQTLHFLKHGLFNVEDKTPNRL